MTIQSVLRKKSTWLIGIPILSIAVFGGGPYIYIHFIEGDPPAKLALAKVKTTKTATAASRSLDGTWNATFTADLRSRATRRIATASSKVASWTPRITRPPPSN